MVSSALFGGHTPLYSAAACGNIEVVRALLKAGADPNQGVVRGAGTSETNTLYALSGAIGGQDEAVLALLDAGAKVELVDRPGALAWATSLSPQTIRRLVTAGLSASSACPTLGPPLFVAARGVGCCHDSEEAHAEFEQRMQVIAVLLDLGASPNDLWQGRTLLSHLEYEHAQAAYGEGSGTRPQLTEQGKREVTQLVAFLESRGAERISTRRSLLMILKAMGCPGTYSTVRCLWQCFTCKECRDDMAAASARTYARSED